MSTQNQRGLYRESFEKDSCGFGLIANLDDQPSHWLVKTAIASLNRLTHRGAIASDGKTGDGCGLLLKMPVKFLRAVAKDAGIRLTKQFGVGNVFLSTDHSLAVAAKAEVERQLEREGLQCAGWRVVPVGPDACGAEAMRTLPRIEQLFVNTREPLDEAEFNRKLFMARRRAERAREHADPVFYLPSLSVSTIVYKGMVMPPHLVELFPDLGDERIEASVAVFHQRFSTNTLPQWKLAHPFRYLAHNGEINTIEAIPSCRWCHWKVPTRKASTTCSKCC
jgi:glutamate synthase (NADPH) large chain